MDGIIVGFDLKFISGLIGVRFFLEFEHTFSGVVLYMNDVPCSKREWLKFTVVLFFIAAPGVSIRTDHVISMPRVGILEHILGLFDFVDMTHTNSDP